MTEKTIRAAIVSFGLDAAAPVILLRESTDNAVFVIGAGDKKKVLRISKHLPVDDIVFECEAVNHLAQNGALVPRFFPATSGKCYSIIEDRITVLFDFTEGHHAEADRFHLPTGRQAFEAGKGLAQIHAAGVDFKPSSTRRRTIFSELERALAFRDIFIKQFEGGAAFIEQIESAIKFGQASREASGLIQNDYRPSNVFFDGADYLAGIIDFDWSCMGPLIKDVALGMLEWSFPDGARKPDFAIFNSFLEGYNSVADQKQMRSQKLYDWISFAALSDAATYFCDRTSNPATTKCIASSYMYQKYHFFAEEKI